ncbi:hypothetical protein Syun_011588 [Stephania yunnanensis]|uniref:Uncharacterized protein n=1 Tax=Stephania yunnanensis TaxID=152371 RepID=A0AAP0JZ12_9MAGN
MFFHTDRSNERMGSLTPPSADGARQQPSSFVSLTSLLSSAFPPQYHHHHSSSRRPSATISHPPRHSILFRDFHASLASSAHRFLSHLRSLLDSNPFFHKLLASSPRQFASTVSIRAMLRAKIIDSIHAKESVAPLIHCSNYSAKSMSAHNFAAILPGDSVAGVVVANGIMNFLNIYNTLLVARLVLTWFPNSPPAIVSPLSTLCDPYLNIFRGIIPPLGGTLDLSPILAFLVLNVFTSTAAALPAELPVTNASESHPVSSPNLQILNLTSTQKKWLKRISGNWPKNSGSTN